MSEPVHIIFEGKSILGMDTFYNEAADKLTLNLGWKPGRNLDAFNDLLRGGFGVFEPNQEVRLTWKDHALSREALGKAATLIYMEEMLQRCHPANREWIREDIEALRRGEGPVLFDQVLQIIRGHDHIELKLA